jgi:hypothetical protein
MENTNITSTESLLADIDKAIDAIQVDYMEPEGKETLSKDIALWSDRNVKERIAQVRAEAYKYRETAKLWMVSVTSALSYGHEWWAVRENPQFWLTQGKGYFGGSVDFQQATDAAQVTGQVYRAIQRLKDIFEDVERKYKASSADTAAQQPTQAEKPAQPITKGGCEFNPIKPFNAEGLHRFLLKEKIIRVNYSTFLACLKSADFTEVYKDCKKAKLKCVIFELKSYYESLWYDMVLQYLGETNSSMSKFNVGDKKEKLIFKEKIWKAMRT